MTYNSVPYNNKKMIDLFMSQHHLRESVIKMAIQAMNIPEKSCGLDAGCGIGLYTMMLAQAVGDFGHVTGLDINRNYLAKAESISIEEVIGQKISYICGDITQIPFANNTFDWAISIDCPGNQPLHTVKELARTVKTGGKVFILLWTAQKLLPGYPLLEARLNTTSMGLLPFRDGMLPEHHYMMGLRWFNQAGLGNPSVKTFLGEVHVPLGSEIKNALAELIDMRWGKTAAELCTDEQLQYLRLTSRESPDYILNSPDYYAFYTYSLFQGTVV